MVASPEPHSLNNSDRPQNPETSYQEEMCEKLIQLSFAKIVNSKTERGGARLHKNLLILHLLQKARMEQRNRLLHASMSMDTTSHVSHHQSPSSHPGQDISCENSVCSMGNSDDGEQMQTGQLEEEADEDAIEIDETSSQQQAMVSVSAEGERAGTFSSPSYDVHLASPCLSSLASSASPESGFDGNYGPGTTVTQPTPPIIQTRQQASVPQETQGRSFDFSTDVKQAANIELQPAHGQCSTQSEAHNEEGKTLRQESDRRRHCPQRRRHRSASTRRTLQRNPSTSASSSSSDSDDSSSSEEIYGLEMESGEEKKSRDCLKRKLDDSYSPDLMAVENSPVSSSEWYSSPKMACIVHGGTVTETTNLPQQQHQSLNGLISVLQSAALTSDEPTKTVSNGKLEENPDLSLATRIYDSESANDDSPLTRSLSCPGLLELACES